MVTMVVEMAKSEKFGIDFGGLINCTHELDLQVEEKEESRLFSWYLPQLLGGWWEWIILVKIERNS